MKQIPNLFTLLNLVFGCMAVILILQTGETLVTSSEQGTWVAQLPEKIWWGSVCIGIAAIVDFLDGFVARLFKATSEIGAQLDSLADVVSFGVAPGMIFYQLLRISFIGTEDGLDVSIWALMPAVIFPCAGAYRLARFNVDKSQAYGFKGVPIPAAGLVVASLPLILLYNYFDLNSILLNKWTLYAMIILLSWLMVSTLPLMALKFKDFSIKNNLPKFILLIVAVVAGIFLKWLAVPVVFLLYVILSLAVAKKEAAH
ncbi:CDP-alcohol phosphatidyltransferase family protein [Pseudobacter ginsenosidimutans]|uniref:CDP-diacylglycerol--serine O-phosphatidyltransferase n=1 Tax=Pseudobacter ginsenosidimutans TaxID=661488 RepID=A0A4Q7MQB2_9BACT|nr:CDP-alcohol phosphatidyltransferase family protein [Pseudobacter ginsenosidimutans]QEC42270.1 CDP-alcohol phosphatidyltransferase [Pseudobacter ginsenosidimutans]RZS70885.1 CDP-diacylglycerol--serine O-phosphatidyltransferase [Pseudobacter ginsenosidimutans]